MDADDLQLGTFECGVLSEHFDEADSVKPIIVGKKVSLELDIVGM